MRIVLFFISFIMGQPPRQRTSSTGSAVGDVFCFFLGVFFFLLILFFAASHFVFPTPPPPPKKLDMLEAQKQSLQLTCRDLDVRIGEKRENVGDAMSNESDEVLETNLREFDEKLDRCVSVFAFRALSVYIYIYIWVR